MRIRAEEARDKEDIYRLHCCEFETEAEAQLVENLHDEAKPLLSLVALANRQLIGHILFSPVILTGHADLKLMGLAPMAVAREYQNQGVGSALVEKGLAECVDLDVDAVVVLGHPDYYPRFGFIPTRNLGIESEYNVPAEVFMLRELKPHALQDRIGQIRYHKAFANL